MRFRFGWCMVIPLVVLTMVGSVHVDRTRAAGVLVGPRSVRAGEHVNFQLDLMLEQQLAGDCTARASNGEAVTSRRYFTATEPIVAVTWRTPKHARSSAWSVWFSCRVPSTGTRTRLMKRFRIRGDVASGVLTPFTAASFRVRARGIDDLRSGAPEPLVSGSSEDAGKDSDRCAHWKNGYESRITLGAYCSGYSTWYVWSQRPEAELQGLGLARDWYSRVPLPTGATPYGGAIAWWAGGWRGHVAIVRSVNSTAIEIEETNALGWNVHSRRVIGLDSPAAPDGYIYGGTASQAKPVQVAAHRGYYDSVTVAENTIGSYIRAASLGVEYVEVDVRRTRDGVLVLNHDAVIGGKRLSRTAFADIPVLSTGQRIDTLADLAEVAARALRDGGRTRLLVELKETGYEDAVLEALGSRLRVDQFDLMSFDPRSVRAVKALSSGVRVGIILNDAPPSGDELAANVAQVGADFVALPFAIATSDRLDALVRNGVSTTLWTVADVRTLRWFLADPRIDRVVTSVPLLAQEARKPLVRSSLYAQSRLVW